VHHVAVLAANLLADLVYLGWIPERELKWRHESLRLPRSPKVVLGLVILGFFVLLMIFGPYLAPYSPDNTSFRAALDAFRAPLFGTTSLGQDIFSQTLVGARATMVVALVAGVVATMLSIIVGVSAGYIGGYADDAFRDVQRLSRVPGCRCSS